MDSLLFEGTWCLGNRMVGSIFTNLFSTSHCYDTAKPIEKKSDIINFDCEKDDSTSKQGTRRP